MRTSALVLVLIALSPAAQGQETAASSFKFTAVAKHPKDTRKARFSVGDEVALLPCAATADTLVYVNGHGQVLTGGKKAFGMLVAGASASTAFLELSLVDARSGEVLAYLCLLNDGKFVNDSEKAYGSRLDKLFKRMKIGNVARK